MKTISAIGEFFGKVFWGAVATVIVLLVLLLLAPIVIPILFFTGILVVIVLILAAVILFAAAIRLGWGFLTGELEWTLKDDGEGSMKVQLRTKEEKKDE